MENRWFYVTALFVLISVASAIPIEPESGGEYQTHEEGSLPQQSIPIPSLPLASSGVALGVFFIVMGLKKDPKSLFSEVEESPAEEAPAKKLESESVNRYSSMLDSARNRLAELEKQAEVCRLRVINEKRRARRNGHSSSRPLKAVEGAYDKVLSEIREVKNTIGILESWKDNLLKLDFSPDEGFKMDDRTYFFSNSVLRGITPEEAYRRFIKKSEKAYNEFTALMDKIHYYVRDNLGRLGWDAVDYAKELLESTYMGFREELNQLRDEYLKEQNGRGGSWNKYHEKLYENYFREFREKSEKLFEDYSLNVDEQAFDVLVPESVKLELEMREREALEKEKLMMRDRKRRWSQQLRDKANRLQKNLLNEYRRLYDQTIFREFKEKIDAWCEEARDAAWKMKWQRTLEKAEARCQEIDLFLANGFQEFQALTHQKAVAELTREYYKPEIDIKEAVEEYRREQPPEPAPTQPNAAIPAQDSPGIVYDPLGVCVASSIDPVIAGEGGQGGIIPVIDLNTGVLGVYVPAEGALMWNYKDKAVTGSYGSFTLGLDYNSSVMGLSFGNSSSLVWDYGGKNLEGSYSDFMFGLDYNNSVANLNYGNDSSLVWSYAEGNIEGSYGNFFGSLDYNNSVANLKYGSDSGVVWDSQAETVEGYHNGFNGVLDYGKSLLNLSYGNLTGFSLDFGNRILEAFYGSHNVRVDEDSLSASGAGNWEPVNQPVNLFYSLNAANNAEKPNAGPQSNSLPLLGFSLEDGNWDVELNLLPFAASKKFKDVGEISVEGRPGIYFWNQGEEFELGEEFDVNVGAYVKELCLGKYCVRDLGAGLYVNVDAPLLEKEVLEDGSRRLTYYPELNHMLELLEYEAEKDVSSTGNAIGLSKGFDGLEFRLIPAAVGLLNGASTPDNKVNQWCLDYLVNKFSKVVPEDQRTLLSSDYLTICLDDPALSNEFMRKDSYQYSKPLDSEVSRTSEFYTSTGCPEGELVCEKVETVTEDTPIWLPVFEFVGDCVGNASNLIYGVFKSLGLDTLL